MSTASDTLYFIRKGVAKIRIEVGVEFRYPFEIPAHALLELLDLGERSTRDSNKGHIAVGQMNGNALKGISKKRATLAPLVPVGTEHEMIHGELCLSVKQVH